MEERKEERERERKGERERNIPFSFHSENGSSLDPTDPSLHYMQ